MRPLDDFGASPMTPKKAPGARQVPFWAGASTAFYCHWVLCGLSVKIPYLLRQWEWAHASRT
jgi:hypothetical protein